MKHNIELSIIIKPIIINPLSATNILSRWKRIADIPIINNKPPRIKFPIDERESNHFLKFKSPFFESVSFLFF